MIYNTPVRTYPRGFLSSVSRKFVGMQRFEGNPLFERCLGGLCLLGLLELREETLEELVAALPCISCFAGYMWMLFDRFRLPVTGFACGVV